MSYKVDLHTHSYGSPDGGLSLEAYRSMLASRGLDYVAITDHNTVEAAQEIQRCLGELGQRIIIGEEITTTEGEIIGLYISRTIPKDLSPEEAIDQIRAQGGLVYVPHPFETVRSGISLEILKRLARSIDILETCNGRAVFQDKSASAKAFATKYTITAAASSDAHGSHGWGKTYSIIDEPPTCKNLVNLLKTARFREGKVGTGILYPKFNRLKRLLGL